MAMTSPVGPTASARSRVWPPPPSVPSTTRMPGFTARNDITSAGRTLVWMLDDMALESSSGMGVVPGGTDDGPIPCKPEARARGIRCPSRKVIRIPLLALRAWMDDGPIPCKP